jgi:hypothetical protein
VYCSEKVRTFYRKTPAQNDLAENLYGVCIAQQKSELFIERHQFKMIWREIYTVCFSPKIRTVY